MMGKNKSMVEQLKAAVLRAERKGITRYRIAKDARLFQSQLSRLLSGDVSPRLDTAERIAKAVGFRIVLSPLGNT